MVARDILASGVRGSEQAIAREEALRLHDKQRLHVVRGGRPGLHRAGKLAGLVVSSDDTMTLP